MPRKRFFTTLLNFDIAVVVYIILNLIIGKAMTMSQIFLSFLAWESVGNSNWYIFCILLCYTLAFFSFLLSDDVNISLFLVIFFSFISMVSLSFLKETWWYNTLLCFSFGMLYSEKKEKFDILIKSRYFWCFIVFLILFCLFRCIPITLRGFIYNMESICFALIVTLVMMKMELKNPYLQWMGERLFPLYIYQRLMMIALFQIPGGTTFISQHPLVYIFFCFATVVLLSLLYPRWQVFVINNRFKIGI